MTEPINGRTPEEIKAGLKACTSGRLPGYGCNISCPYLNAENCWFLIKRDALALIERLESERDAALAKVPKWIGVEERLPEPFVSVLVQMPGEEPHPTVREGFITHAGIWSAGYFKRDPDEVTHWMPLPESPEEGE